MALGVFCAMVAPSCNFLGSRDITSGCPTLHKVAAPLNWGEGDQKFSEGSIRKFSEMQVFLRILSDMTGQSGARSRVGAVAGLANERCQKECCMHTSINKVGGGLVTT